VNVEPAGAEALAKTAQAPAPQASAEPASQPMASYTPPALTVSRRPALELSLPLAGRAAATAPGRSPEEHSLDLDSPLDVPAFLRRQS